MPDNQRGVLLIEAMIGLIIFAIGVLAMIALQAKAIAIQADTQYRVEAANLADRMLGEITLRVNRTGGTQAAQTANIQASLAAFAHQPTTSGPCNFTGTASGDADVQAWVNDIMTNPVTRLPGVSANMQQIQVNTGTFNQVIVTICWQGAADAVPRQHTLVSYIN